MIRATLRGLLSRKLRLVLSALSVVLGVMFVSGAFVLTDTLSRSFDQLFSTVFSNTDVQVSAVQKVSQGGDSERVTTTIPESTVDSIRGVDGVAHADGMVFAPSDNGHVYALDPAIRLAEPIFIPVLIGLGVLGLAIGVAAAVVFVWKRSRGGRVE